jgi:hypothetical protein
MMALQDLACRSREPQALCEPLRDLVAPAAIAARHGHHATLGQVGGHSSCRELSPTKA